MFEIKMSPHVTNNLNYLQKLTTGFINSYFYLCILLFLLYIPLEHKQLTVATRKIQVMRGF